MNVPDVTRCIIPRREENEKPHLPMIGSLVCAGHDTQLRGYLLELTNYPAALVAAVTAETMSVKLSSISVSGSTEDRMPIGDARSDHLLDVRDILWSWSKDIADQRGVNRPDLSDVWITARFLARHQLWITAQGIVADYHSELRDLVSTGRGLLHPSKGNNRTQLPCPLTESESCTGTLASVPTGDDDDETNTACDMCGYILSPGQFRTYKRQLRKRLDPDGADGPDLVTENDMKLWALAAGIPDATVRSWLHRQELVGQEIGGRVLFDLDKVQALADRRKAAAA